MGLTGLAGISSQDLNALQVNFKYTTNKYEFK